MRSITSCSTSHKGQLASEHYDKSHYDMKNNRINSIVNLLSPERYDYFIRKVSDFEEVWGLIYENWGYAPPPFFNIKWMAIQPLFETHKGRLVKPES